MYTIDEKCDRAIALVSNVHDVMVKLLGILKEHGIDTKQSYLIPNVTSSSKPHKAVVIDLDEWTASIDKHKVEMLVKELKNGRSDVYVSGDGADVMILC